MAKVQLLQNTEAAKLIADKAKYSSATEGITELNWLVFFFSEKRRKHRLSFVFKCMHGLIGCILILRTEGKLTPMTLDTKITFKCPNLGASGLGATKTELSSNTRMERSSNV